PKISTCWTMLRPTSWDAPSAPSAMRQPCRSEASSSISETNSPTTLNTGSVWYRSICNGRTYNRRRLGRSAGGQHGDARRQQAWRVRAALLLSQEALDCRELPHVPGRGREG